jgi:serine/threonine protein phosphatase PrpC
MLRVAEQYAGTDTGLARRVNEDALLAQPPLFAVADGMGGAQAGEVASRTAVECLTGGVEEGGDREGDLSRRIEQANARIHELSRENAEQAGMGTTLTALYVDKDTVTLAHVGDSRAYLVREGRLVRLTEDHSLVDELIRQGRLTPEEAQEHPQRSVITRALGPEPDVEVDTLTQGARDGDIYLICSDGLTTMVSEERVEQILREHASLREAGEALLKAANDAGGRDNITVILLRLEQAAPHGARGATGAGGQPRGGAQAGVPGGAQAGVREGEAAGGREGEAVRRAVDHRTQRRVAVLERPRAAVKPLRPRRQQAERVSAGTRRARPRALRIVLRPATLAVVVVLALVAAGAWLATRSIYFIGTNGRGLVTIYSGLPYALPAGIKLYSTYYVSGVPATEVPSSRQGTILDNKLRTGGGATGLVRSLELEQLAGE